MHRIATTACTFFLLVALASAPPVAAQLDMHGVFNVTMTVPALGSTVQTTWTVAHTGTVITVDANDPGTIDLGTEAFQFRFDQLCEPQVTGTLDANGNISGSFPLYGPSPSCASSPQAFFTGTRCGNGTLDPMEGCDPQSVCCFRCRHSPAGLACDSDLNACTADACDGAGACAHTPLPATTACASDGQACTTGGAAWNTSPKRIIYRDAANADGITNVTLVPGTASRSPHHRRGQGRRARPAGRRLAPWRRPTSCSSSRVIVAGRRPSRRPSATATRSCRQNRNEPVTSRAIRLLDAVVGTPATRREAPCAIDSPRVPSPSC